MEVKATFQNTSYEDEFPTCRLELALKFSCYLVLVERIFLCYVGSRSNFSHAYKGLSQVISLNVWHVVVHFVVDWLLVSCPPGGIGQLSWQPNQCLRPNGGGLGLNWLAPQKIGGEESDISFSRPGITNTVHLSLCRNSRRCLIKNSRWSHKQVSVVFYHV